MTQAEIEQAHSLLAHHDVGRFHIAMQNTLLVRMSQCIQQLQGNGLQLPPRQSIRALQEQAIKGHALQQLHGEERNLVRCIDLESKRPDHVIVAQGLAGVFAARDLADQPVLQHRPVAGEHRRSRAGRHLGSDLVAPAAQAQWQTITYTLRGGWNAIYLQGDATHTTIDNLFAGTTSVISVWRWNPNPNPAQFKASSIIPTASTPEWSVWVKGDTAQTTLTSLSGQMAYLVKCSGLAADTYTVAITQRILPPKSTWVRNGANFLGFPALAGTSAPTVGRRSWMVQRL